MKRNTYTKKTKEEVVRRYTVDKLKSKDLAAIYNIPVGTVGEWVRKAGVARHRGPKSMIGNEDYFSIIDCEEKSYWLGWLMADGCISKYAGQKSIKLHISIKDKKIVDDFLSTISF